MKVSEAELKKHQYEINIAGFSIVDHVIDDQLCARLKQELVLTLDKDWKAYGTLPGKTWDLVNNLVIYG
ncbi:MAG TPA: hypothetical protein VL359_14035, partial [bacterium]|nr:hypothetical protein [bacterium]